MAGTQDHPVLRFIRRITASGGVVDGSDGQLLASFVARRDEAAFTALVRRHGSLVYGVCFRILGATADAEDAFQAVFLVLARRAASLREPASLSSWLYGVALRTALKARTETAGRRARERRVAAVTVTDPADDAARRELRRVMDDELSRLPEKYRTPVVLCYLEGQTQEEAARLLGCPRKTVTTRLARACERLRGPLTRRGLALSATALAVLLAEEAFASAPAAWTASTIQAATMFAMGNETPAAVSARALALTRKVLKTMFLMRLTKTAAVLLAVVVFCAAAGALAYPALATDDARGKTTTPVAAPEEPKENAALKELQGEWNAVELTDGGRTYSGDDVKSKRWTFKGAQLQTTGPGQYGFKAEIAVDATTSPKQIDVKVLDGDLKGTALPGIYKLEKGRLIVCLRDESDLAKGRPTEFTGVRGSAQGMITLEKANKEPEKAADAAAELQGEWKVIGLATEGRTATADDVKGMSWTIKGSTMQGVNPGDKPGEKAEIKVDASKDPKHFDVVIPEGTLKGQTMPGIYKLENGRLTVCLRDEQELALGRPKEFTVAKGSAQGIITLEKVTKEKD